MSIPIWFLDIDGVINALDDGHLPHLTQTTARTMDTDWPIRYFPDVIEFINLVHRQGLAEVRWLTTWGQDARTSLAPAVGLDDFYAYDLVDSTGWWKADIVGESIERDARRIVWTDDDLDTEDVSFLDGQTSHAALVIAPAALTGLTSIDLSRVAGWLTAGVSAT